MHPEGGSWTEVRTHTPSKFSKVRAEPLAPIPLDRSKFRENGSQPSPNRACTLQRTRLSILAYVPEAYCVIGQHSHDLLFSMELKDCLPSPQRPAFDGVATSYTLADPEGSGCSTHYRQTLGTMETPSPYRCLHGSITPAEAILHFTMMELRRIEVSRSFVEPTRLWVARKSWCRGSGVAVPCSSDAALQLSLRRCASIHASELGFRQLSFHHVRLTLTPRYERVSSVGALSRHAPLPLLFRGFQAITGRDKPVCTGEFQHSW